MITKEQWKNSSRSERYRYLKINGATSTDARRVRDFGYEKLLLYQPELRTGPRKPLAKAKKMPYVPKLSISERKGMWAMLSRYWHKTGTAKQRMYNTFTDYEKKASNDWQKEAVSINRELWSQMSREQKMLLRWSEAETYSVGYAAVYRHYILGMTWNKAMEGLIIDPTVEPDEY